MNKRRFYLNLLIGLFTFVFVGSAWARSTTNLPTAPSGYVNDFSGIIDPQDQQAIGTLASSLDAKTSAQVAVVTVKSTYPDTIENYAVKLFQKWGIGQKGKDNGVLFLIASQDHKLRIEVGYGLEGAITDAISSKIINQIVVPEFRQGRISYGILQGSRAIISLIAKEYGVTITGQETAVYNSLHQDTSALWMIIFVFLLMFMFYAFSFRHPGLGWLMVTGGFLGGGGGWSGGGGGFGGFGGFGGGMSGGGGASGGW